MTRTCRIGLVVLGLSLAVGSSEARQAQKNPECSVAKKGSFTIGFILEQGGTFYRCLQTFDGNLKPAGAAWVEVTRNGQYQIKKD